MRRSPLASPSRTRPTARPGTRIKPLYRKRIAFRTLGARSIVKYVLPAYGGPSRGNIFISGNKGQRIKLLQLGFIHRATTFVQPISIKAPRPKIISAWVLLLLKIENHCIRCAAFLIGIFICQEYYVSPELFFLPSFAK